MALADAAAHSYRGVTARNAVMFGSSGRLYTYLSHGIHVCANVVCGPTESRPPSAQGCSHRNRIRHRPVPARGGDPHWRAGAWARGISARRPESPWPTTESTCLISDSPIRLTLNDAPEATSGPSRRCQPSCRSAVAAVVARPGGGLRLPAQSTSARHRAPATDSNAPSGRPPRARHGRCERIFDVLSRLKAGDSNPVAPTLQENRVEVHGS